jgi:hypothetical protein
MPRSKERPELGLKLEVTIIPAKYLDWTLAEIARHFGNGPLLWPGGVGRAHGIKFVPYEVKKKRGRKPKPKEPTARAAQAEAAVKPTN